VQAQELVGPDAAAQELPELLLDEVRCRSLARLCAGEERLELLADDAVQERPVGRVRRVLEHVTQ